MTSSGLRILVVQPGARTSTADVYNGLVRALERAGVTCIKYDLGARITMAGGALSVVYRVARRAAHKRGDPAPPKPTAADEQMQAHSDLLLRAYAYDCDWILFVSAMYTAPYIFRQLRKTNLKIACVFTESPYNDTPQAEIAAQCDLAFVNDRDSVEPIRVAQPNTHYLAPAYDRDIHTFMPEQTADADASADASADAPADAGVVCAPSHDVVFVGTGFYERIEMLSAVDWDALNCDFGLYGVWDHLPGDSPLRAHLVAGEIDNRYTAALYQRARIGINLFRQSERLTIDSPRSYYGASCSPRSMELAACGLFHLSEDRPEVREIFGDLVPRFNTPRELQQALAYWLDPARTRERDRICGLLPQAVIGHTWDDRARVLLEHMAPAHAR